MSRHVTRNRVPIGELVPISGAPGWFADTSTQAGLLLALGLYWQDKYDRLALHREQTREEVRQDLIRQGWKAPKGMS